MSNSRYGLASEIMQLPGNKSGNDFIMADLHGNKPCFEAVLDRLALTASDRLFIAGDLVDRGIDSPGVIEMIMAHNRKGGGQIYAVRGNHEDMTLESISALEDILRNLDVKEDKLVVEVFINKLNSFFRGVHSNLSNHLIDNEGKWILNLFLEELIEGKIVKGKNEIIYSEDSKVKAIRDFMKVLPYVIHVTSVREPGRVLSDFAVVHADMPFGDVEMVKRIKKGEGLTPSEKEYCVWARKEGSIRFEPNGRIEVSSIAYCGHQIIDDKIKYLDQCVRRATSTVNLDYGAFATNVSLVVNHSKSQAFYVSADNELSFAGQEFLDKKLIKSIEAYIVEKGKLEEVRNIMRDTVAKMASLKNPVLKLGGECVRKISEKVKELFEFPSLQDWGVRIWVYMHADSHIESDMMRNINSKIVKEILLDPNMSWDAKKNCVESMAHCFNFFHRPEEPLKYSDLLLPPAKVTQVGMFAIVKPDTQGKNNKGYQDKNNNKIAVIK